MDDFHMLLMREPDRGVLIRMLNPPPPADRPEEVFLRLDFGARHGDVARTFGRTLSYRPSFATVNAQTGVIVAAYTLRRPGGRS